MMTTQGTLDLIGNVLGFISQFGVVGKYVAIALGMITGLSAVITALVGMWHAVVALIKAGSTVPWVGSSLASLATTLQADSDSIDAKANQVLAFIAQLSMIPLPQKPAAPAPASPPAPAA